MSKTSSFPKRLRPVTDRTAFFVHPSKAPLSAFLFFNLLEGLDPFAPIVPRQR